MHTWTCSFLCTFLFKPTQDKEEDTHTQTYIPGLALSCAPCCSSLPDEQLLPSFCALPPPPPPKQAPSAGPAFLAAAPGDVPLLRTSKQLQHYSASKFVQANNCPLYKQTIAALLCFGIQGGKASQRKLPLPSQLSLQQLLATCTSFVQENNCSIALL